MHILVIPSWYPRHAGDARGCFFREQALALRQAGHKVGVITVEIGSVSEWRSQIRNVGVRHEIDGDISTYRLSGLVWPARFPSANAIFWKTFGKLLFRQYVEREGMPDVIHVHGMLYGGVLGRAISRVYGLPLVVTEHSSFYGRGLLSAAQLRTAASVALAASARLAVSEALCRQLQERLPSIPAGWRELPNVVDQRFFLPRADDIASTGSFSFLSIALLTKNKCIHVLLEAFAQAFAGRPDVCLKIGGGGPELGRLGSLAEELGISRQVVFLGMLSRDDVDRELATADVFVLPSEFETFGVVVAEALARGTPVIATRCGGPQSIVRPQDGLLVPVNDVPAMAEALLQMHDRAHSFDASEIRAACLARYGAAAIARRLTALYDELVCGKRMQPAEVRA